MFALRMFLISVVSVSLVAGAAARPDPPQQVKLDDVLTAYLGGDTEIVARTFVRPRDFQDRLRTDVPRELERWLGSWDRGKALLLIEIARVSVSVAPRYTAVLANAGRTYVGTARADGITSIDVNAFIRLWHHAAIGLLQVASEPDRVEQYAGDLNDARLVLARAVAQERRCWDMRPARDQPSAAIEAVNRAAGITIAEDSAGPTKAAREAGAKNYAACLRTANAKFEVASKADGTSAEARVRASWGLFQEGRFADALTSLDAADPRGDDRDLSYWHALFRGRVLDALGRAEEARVAYQRALAICPGAQSASVGLALELVRLDRADEADEIAHAQRSAGAATADPWSTYFDADRRFVDRWIDQMKAALR